MKNIPALLTLVAQTLALPESTAEKDFPTPPAAMNPCGRRCIESVYQRARNNQDNIMCSGDRSASCVCDAANVNFWYGIRDCSQKGCGNAVYEQVATWKDDVLCANRQDPSSFPTSVVTKTTPAPSSSAAPSTPQIITYEDEGITKTITINRKSAVTAAPAVGLSM